MSRKETDPGRSVHRVDLSLPVVQTDSYEIFYNAPPQQNLRATVHRKPLIENNRKNAELASRTKSAARLKQLMGPVFVNVFVDTTTMTAESISTTGDTSSNMLLNQSFSNRPFKALPTVHKTHKQKNNKDDCNRSRSSSEERLLYESLGSFDTMNLNKSRNHNMWQNIHHPQLTTSKVLHFRSISRPSFVSNDAKNKAFNSKSSDYLLQESTATVNEQLHEKIEEFTKNYFPVIQRIRHSHPSPDVVSSRNYLHHRQSQNFMPILSRTRAVR